MSHWLKIGIAASLLVLLLALSLWITKQQPMPPERRSVVLSLNFVTSMAVLSNVSHVAVKLVPDSGSDIRVYKKEIHGSGVLALSFNKDHLGPLATLTAQCRIGKDESGKKVTFNVNYNGKEVYFIKVPIVLDKSSKAACNVFIKEKTMPEKAYLDGATYHARFQFSYSANREMLQHISLKKHRQIIPITLIYSVTPSSFLLRKRICVPKNTYVSYLHSIKHGKQSSSFKPMHSPNMNTPVRIGLNKEWRWNLVYDPKNPQKLIGQQITMKGTKSCNNYYCGEQFCVNHFRVKYVVTDVQPLTLKCVTDRYHDTCNGKNRCKNIYCTPTVWSNGESVTIKCTERGPFSCLDY
jgi:hypothetical protein